MEVATCHHPPVLSGEHDDETDDAEEVLRVRMPMDADGHRTFPRN